MAPHHRVFGLAALYDTTAPRTEPNRMFSAFRFPRNSNLKRGNEELGNGMETWDFFAYMDIGIGV